MIKLVMLVGIPGSGKSEVARKYEKKGYKIHSSDELRRELYLDINNQNNNVKLFEILHKRIKNDLINGENVVYDATNISYKRRKNFIESLNKIECSKIALVIATPFNECIKRDKERERSVGNQVIDRMYKSFSMPSKMEGFNKINILYSNFNKEDYNIMNKISFLRNINQFNTHHTLSIGNHCIKVRESLFDIKIATAGLLHDIGKQYTMSFKNSKGEYTDQAHYYSHENVSAYESMFYLKDQFTTEDIIYICNLINFHMRPHLLTTEKSINKLKRFLGEDFYNDLMLLHEADKNAK